MRYEEEPCANEKALRICRAYCPCSSLPVSPPSLHCPTLCAPSILTVLLSRCPLPLPRHNRRQHLLHLKNKNKTLKKKPAVDTIIPANLSTVCSVSNLEYLIQYSPILQRDQYQESSFYRLMTGFLKQKAEKQP